jgi:hypothetical protein
MIPHPIEPVDRIISQSLPSVQFEEKPMKRIQIAILAAASCLCLTGSVSAQLGNMNPFKKPNIADIFKPVVGNGGLYEKQRTDRQAAPTQFEMTVVGKETVDGEEGYWMEFGTQESKTGQMIYGKSLMTRDFKFKKMVFQQPGKPAMEMSFNPTDRTKSHMSEEMEKWHQVGTESITVPAGTFSCAHWKKDTGVGDVWVSDKVTPMGMVKSVSEGETMVLLKVITGAQDHITGPVTKFDPQLMMQQMQQQMQRQKPQ